MSAPPRPGDHPGAPDDDPGSLDGTVRHLHPRTRLVWAAGTALPILVVGTLAGVLLDRSEAYEWVILVIAATAATLALAGLGAQLAWSRWTWTAWEDALELHHGVLVERASLVPYHRIQQIDLHRGPIERVVGVSSLILRTASATSDARLPGIAAEQAETLRHRLLTRAGVDDAV